MERVTIFYITFAILAFTRPSYAEVGGHDLFTSLAQLEVLWKNEMKVVQVMQDTLEKLDKAKVALNAYIKSHYELQLDKGPNYDFLGHPINAYHFVRHVASGWKHVQDHVIGNATLRDNLNSLKDREQEKLPDDYDIKGGAFGLVRLKSLYNFKLEPFVEEGVISTTLDNGQVVLSRPSVLKLNSFDLYSMGQQGCETGFFDSCTDYLQAALQSAQNEQKNQEDLTHLYGYVANPINITQDLKMARFNHDVNLEKHGQRTHVHRTHDLPFDAKLRKKKKFKKKNKAVKKEWIMGRERYFEQQNKADHDSNFGKEFKNIVEEQKDLLCRGQELRSVDSTSKLKCFYGHNASPWLFLGPFKIEENSLDPYHVSIYDLLYPHECDQVTEFLGPLLDFPPGRMNHRNPKNDWTMKNCWPKENQNVQLQKLNRRIEHIGALNANSFKNYSEPYMCGNYGIGGHYWIHPDYHRNTNMHYLPGTTGNRVATVLTVLESPEAGGATVWPYAGFQVFGRKGSGLFWHNNFNSDINDAFTQHAACPVLLGAKWIGNKWVGYNAQWNRRKCRLLPYQSFLPIRHFQRL